MNVNELNVLIAEIEKAADGATLKKAIINAIIAINESGGNAMKFAGHNANYFYYKDDFEIELRNLRNLLDVYSENPVKTETSGSYKLVQSGNVFNYINALLQRLNAINGPYYNYDSDSETWTKDESKSFSSIVAEALTRLSRTKGYIKDEIVNKGGTIEEADTFEDYAKRLLAVNPYNITDVKITKNEKKTAPEGTVYGIIDVDVKPVVEAKLITEEGTHEVPEGVDAWNPVTISIKGGRTPGSSGSGGYSPSGSHTPSAADLDLATVDAEKNGTYRAADTQKSAIGTINVNVTGIDIDILRTMRFTVTFQNPETGEVYEVQDKVVGGTSAVYGTQLLKDHEGEPNYKLPLPTKETEDGTIWIFTKWDPAPTYVDHDMVCNAVFEEVRYSASDSELSWEDICSGARVTEGTIKVLNLLPYVGDEYMHYNMMTTPWVARDTVYFGPIRMICVGNTDGGSTWISIDNIPYIGESASTYTKPDGGKWGDWESGHGSFTYRASESPLGGYYISNDKCGIGRIVERGDPAYDAATKFGWINSPMRTWLNDEFLNKCIPPMIRDNIKGRDISCYNGYTDDPDDTTIKDAVAAAKEANVFDYIKEASPGYDGSSRTYWIKKQKIWIPSVREIWCAYSKAYSTDTSGTAAKNLSDNALGAVEREGSIFYGEFGNPVEYSLEDWNNDRPKAMKSIYSKAGEYMTLKHLYFYPFDGLLRAPDRPIHHNAGNSIRYTDWITRSFYNGHKLCINQYGSSKSNMAISEEIHLDSNPNICLDTGSSICFGFVIG